MPIAKTNYTILHIVSSVCMILALAWLTISTPFVYDYQQSTEISKQQSDSSSDRGCPNPVSEEKTETGVNTLSEYLHELHGSEHSSLTIVKYYKCRPSDLYFAFHPELISPPPKIMFS